MKVRQAIENALAVAGFALLLAVVTLTYVLSS